MNVNDNESKDNKVEVDSDSNTQIGIESTNKTRNEKDNENCNTDEGININLKHESKTGKDEVFDEEINKNFDQLKEENKIVIGIQEVKYVSKSNDAKFSLAREKLPKEFPYFRIYGLIKKTKNLEENSNQPNVNNININVNGKVLSYSLIFEDQLKDENNTDLIIGSNFTCDLTIDGNIFKEIQDEHLKISIKDEFCTVYPINDSQVSIGHPEHGDSFIVLEDYKILNSQEKIFIGTKIFIVYNIPLKICEQCNDIIYNYTIEEEITDKFSAFTSLKKQTKKNKGEIEKNRKKEISDFFIVKKEILNPICGDDTKDREKISKAIIKKSISHAIIDKILHKIIYDNNNNFFNHFLLDKEQVVNGYDYLPFSTNQQLIFNNSILNNVDSYSKFLSDSSYFLSNVFSELKRKTYEDWDLIIKSITIDYKQKIMAIYKGKENLDLGDKSVEAYYMKPDLSKIEEELFNFDSDIQKIVEDRNCFILKEFYKGLKETIKIINKSGKIDNQDEIENLNNSNINANNIRTNISEHENDEVNDGNKSIINSDVDKKDKMKIVKKDIINKQEEDELEIKLKEALKLYELNEQESKDIKNKNIKKNTDIVDEKCEENSDNNKYCDNADNKDNNDKNIDMDDFFYDPEEVDKAEPEKKNKKNQVNKNDNEDIESKANIQVKSESELKKEVKKNDTEEVTKREIIFSNDKKEDNDEELEELKYKNIDEDDEIFVDFIKGKMNKDIIVGSSNNAMNKEKIVVLSDDELSDNEKKEKIQKKSNANNKTIKNGYNQNIAKNQFSIKDEIEKDEYNNENDKFEEEVKEHSLIDTLFYERGNKHSDKHNLDDSVINIHEKNKIKKMSNDKLKDWLLDKIEEYKRINGLSTKNEEILNLIFRDNSVKNDVLNLKKIKKNVNNFDDSILMDNNNYEQNNINRNNNNKRGNKTNMNVSNSNNNKMKSYNDFKGNKFDLDNTIIEPSKSNGNYYENKFKSQNKVNLNDTIVNSDNTYTSQDRNMYIPKSKYDYGLNNITQINDLNIVNEENEDDNSASLKKFLNDANDLNIDLNTIQTLKSLGLLNTNSTIQSSQLNNKIFIPPNLKENNKEIINNGNESYLNDSYELNVRNFMQIFGVPKAVELDEKKLSYFLRDYFNVKLVQVFPAKDNPNNYYIKIILDYDTVGKFFKTIPNEFDMVIGKFNIHFNKKGNYAKFSIHATTVNSLY